MSSRYNQTASFLLTIDDYRNAINDEIKPSFVNITTITLISKGCDRIFDIPAIKDYYEKRNNEVSITSSNGRGKVDTSIKLSTKFYNQVTITYKCDINKTTKSIKVFPNGSIQIAGCSNIMNCERVLLQLQTILNHILGVDVTLDSFRVVMINSNFSLNYIVHLVEIEDTFSSNDLFDVSYEPDKYSAVKIKFQPANDMKRVTVSIFSTGKVIITGAETLKEIAYSYRIINEMISQNTKIKFSPTEKCDVLDLVMGYRMKDIVSFFKKKQFSPWEYNRINQQINF